MEKKSMKINTMLNSIKTTLTIIFPMITFPYASRILQVENLGKVNFSNSIIAYFSLLAALGISNYAIREGARLRNNRERFNEFANQIFTINMIFTVVSYLLLFIFIGVFSKLFEYRTLLLIHSISILFSTLGVNWIYSVYEDYYYITLRSLVFQIISLILLFILVKDKEDYYLYALISVFSSIGSNILNFSRSRKYLRLRLTKNINFKKHFKPIAIIFLTTIATSIYLNSDMTILGLMTGDYYVGLYSSSVKIYNIIKSILSSIIIVMLPRLSSYISEGREIEYNKMLKKLFNVLSYLIIPIFIGVNILADEVILIIAGNSYIEAVSSLQILSVALIFSVLSSFYTTAILIPMKKERYLLIATIVAAVLNIALNMLLIPSFQQNGAAFTTAVSEFTVFLIASFYTRHDVRLNGIARNAITSMISCVGIVLIAIILKNMIFNVILYTVITFICSVVFYGLSTLLLKNELSLEILEDVKKKLFHK